MKNIIRIGIVLTIIMAHLNVTGQERKLSLQEALSIARNNNRALTSRLLETEEAKEGTRIARGNMLPSVYATGNYSYYFDRQVIFMPGAFAGNEAQPVVDVAVGGKNTFNTSLLLNQPLVSEATRRQIKSSRIGEEIKSLNAKNFSSDLTVDVTVAYYRILLLQQSLELNRQSLERNIRSLSDSRSLLFQGKALKVDTLRNHILVENLKTTIQHQENQEFVAQLTLRQLLGMDEALNIVLTDSLTMEAQQIPAGITQLNYREAIRKRPDMQAHTLEVELAENNLKQKKAERLPTISFLAAYQVQAQADHRNLGDYRWPSTSFVGLQANVPIFTGWRTSAKINQSRLEYKRKELELKEANERALTEVAVYESSLLELTQRAKIQEQTIEAAQLNYLVMSDRYKNGLSSRLEVTDAELTLTEAKLNRLQTIFLVKVATLQYEKSLGQTE